MNIYNTVSNLFESFLKDMAGKEDFIYEVFSKDPKSKFGTTYRSRDIPSIAKHIQKQAPDRDVFISPYSTQYPEKSCDYLCGHKMTSSNSIVIDIDSSGKNVDHHEVQRQLKKHNIPLPTYLVSSGKGCHLWYVLSEHVGLGRIRDIYVQIRDKIANIVWSEEWHVDDRSVKQQFRIPFTINHKYDKLVTIVKRGKKIKISKSNFTRPKVFTKKDLKRLRKSKKTKKRKKTKIEVKTNVEESSRERFLEGAKSLIVSIKEKVHVNVVKLKKIIRLLSYGESYLACRIAGEALGISKEAAASFLRKCVALGYLERIENNKHTAYSYIIKVKHTVEQKEVKLRCAIDGPGQSNKALCKLAFQVHTFKLDAEKTIKKWLHRFYHLTSGEHSIDEMITTFQNVCEKFASGRYKPYNTT